MTTYQIPVKQVVQGHITVEANSIEEAAELVKSDPYLVNGNIQIHEYEEVTTDFENQLTGINGSWTCIKQDENGLFHEEKGW